MINTTIKKKKVLVTGGAGYIGSSMVHKLLDNGYIPIIIDNFSTGSKKLLPDGIKVFEADICSGSIVTEILKSNDITKVIHFAGSISY